MHHSGKHTADDCSSVSRPTPARARNLNTIEARCCWAHLLRVSDFRPHEVADWTNSSTEKKERAMIKRRNEWDNQFYITRSVFMRQALRYIRNWTQSRCAVQVRITAQRPMLQCKEAVKTVLCKLTLKWLDSFLSNSPISNSIAVG